MRAVLLVVLVGLARAAQEEKAGQFVGRYKFVK